MELHHRCSPRVQLLTLGLKRMTSKIAYYVNLLRKSGAPSDRHARYITIGTVRSQDLSSKAGLTSSRTIDNASHI